MFVLKQIAINTECCGMQFLVIIWNQDSVEYYTRLGALDLSCEEGWHLFRFNLDDLLELAEEEWKQKQTTTKKTQKQKQKQQKNMSQIQQDVANTKALGTIMQGRMGEVSPLVTSHLLWYHCW